MALEDVQVCVGDVMETLSVLSTRLCINLPHSVSLAHTVTVYGAVMSPNQHLVKSGDYIRISTDIGVVRYSFNILITFSKATNRTAENSFVVVTIYPGSSPFFSWGVQG